MAAITVWCIAGVFAAAPGYFSLGFNFDGFRAKPCAFMRAITEGLILALAACAPSVCSGLHFLDNWFLLSNVRLFHSSYHFAMVFFGFHSKVNKNFAKLLNDGLAGY